MSPSIAGGARFAIEASSMEDAMETVLWTGLMAEAERELVVSALEALLRERSNAYRIAEAAALRTGREPPNVADFGLTDVLGLSRQLSSSR
jgi:hypothetical protein